MPSSRRDARDRERSRHPLTARATGDLPDEPLPRNAEAERPAEPRKLAEIREQFERVIERLAEADSGVETNRLRLDTRFAQNLQSLLEELSHLKHHIVVLRIALHRLWGALHVHDDDPSPVLGRYVESSPDRENRRHR